MNAQTTPNRHELPTNNTHEMFLSASKRAHELPPKELLNKFLRKLKYRCAKDRARLMLFGGAAYEN